jgi:hypothetical protein
VGSRRVGRVFRRQYQEGYGWEAAALWGQQSADQQGFGPGLSESIFVAPVIHPGES